MPIDPTSVLWNSPEHERAGRPHLVLLHGYGSNEGDLFQLASYLPRDLVLASVRAPLPHPLTGYAWYPINNDADGSGVDEAADDLAEFLEGVRGHASWLGTLGFSQGGVVGLQVLRRHPGLIDAHVMLASARHPQELPHADAELELRRPPVFWGRGTADTVFPAWRFADTAEWLPNHTRLTERVYEGLGHAVSEPMLADVVAFLDVNLANRD